MNSKYAGFNGMPLNVAEMYADNKRNWKPGDTLYTANNQNIRDAYGITQDVPLAQVEEYISALKREGTKNQLLTKISSTELPTAVTSAAEKIQNFNYNPDNDVAYKSYVDAYNRQGQSAAKQTLNNLNASNMGRNSSYGAAATAQVQAAYAKQAADMIPQLAQQAYDRLVNNYSIAKDIEDTKYNRAITGYNALADADTRQLTDEQLDLNNQAAELELAYLPPTLRQQVESREITLEQARLQLALDQKYADKERQAALANMYRSGSGGSGGGGSSLTGFNTKTVDSFMKGLNASLKGDWYDEFVGDGDVIVGTADSGYSWKDGIGNLGPWEGPVVSKIMTSPTLTEEEQFWLINQLGLNEPRLMDVTGTAWESAGAGNIRVENGKKYLWISPYERYWNENHYTE